MDFIFPALAKVPSVSSYISPSAKYPLSADLPPVNNIFPFGRVTAICSLLPVPIAPVVENTFAVGSYTCALTRVLVEFCPAIKTLPEESVFAVWLNLERFMLLLIKVNIPVVGSYTSALDKFVVRFAPPDTNTFPELNNMALWVNLARFILPVAVNTPVAGSYNSAVAYTVVLPILERLPPPVNNTLPFCNTVAV